jgi:hypothetical protein
VTAKFIFGDVHKVAGRGTIFSGEVERGSISVGMYLVVGEVALSIRGVEGSSHGSHIGLILRHSEVDSSGVLGSGHLVKGREYDVIQSIGETTEETIIMSEQQTPLDVAAKAIEDIGKMLEKLTPRSSESTVEYSLSLKYTCEGYAVLLEAMKPRGG